MFFLKDTLFYENRVFSQYNVVVWLGIFIYSSSHKSCKCQHLVSIYQLSVIQRTQNLRELKKNEIFVHQKLILMFKIVGGTELAEFENFNLL